MANKRHQFLVQTSNLEEIRRKYGGNIEDALFRFQLDYLRSKIDPKVFDRKPSRGTKET